MYLFLLALGLVALVVLAGTLIVRAVASLPLSVLEQAEEGGRFVGLGSQGQSAATPPTGRRLTTLVPARDAA